MNKIISGALCILFVLQACQNGQSVTENSKENSLTQLKDLTLKYPDSIPLIVRYIDTLEHLDNFKEAINQINRLLAKDSFNTDILNKKADIYYLDRDTLNAQKTMEQSFAIKPDVLTAIPLGVIYAQQKNENAIKMAALLMNPKGNTQKEAYFIKGLYYSYTSKFKEAIGYFDQSLSYDYRNGDTYREKAFAQFNLAQYENALMTLDKSLQFNPQDDEAYYWLGQCFQKLNRTQDAIDSYKTALSIDPNFLEAKDALVKMGIN